MANITRFDPMSDFDDLFKGFFVRPDTEDLASVQMKLNGTRAEDIYTVKA